jgi:hypothetical protein
MATEAQIHANHRNSQISKIPIHRESTGPRSPEGKAVVSKNAVKHGLFALEAGIADIRRPGDQDAGDPENRESG